jgi:hypothetical protein
MGSRVSVVKTKAGICDLIDVAPLCRIFFRENRERQLSRRRNSRAQPE